MKLVFLLWSIFLQIVFCTYFYAQNETLNVNKIPFTIQECLAQAQKKEEEGDYKEASRFLNMAATIHWERKEHDQAIAIFHRSLVLNEKIDNQHGIAGIYSNLGMLYADIRNYPKSLECFEKALAYRRKGKDKVSIISALINTSVVLNNLKQYNRAAELLEQALDLAREMNDISQMKSCYGMLAETYEKAGNHKQMLHYFELYRSFHELVQKEKESHYRALAEAERLRADLLAAQAQNQELKLQLKNQIIEQQRTEISSKEAQNRALLETKTKQELIMAVLRQQAEIEKMKVKETQAQLQVASLTRNILILGSVFLVIVIVILYINYASKKKLNRLLVTQNNEILQQREHILNQKLALEEAYSEIQQKNIALEQSLITIKQQQAEIIQKEKLAAAASLAANIAHELNTPLGVIGSYAQQAESKIGELLAKWVLIYPQLNEAEKQYLIYLVQQNDSFSYPYSPAQEKQFIKQLREALQIDAHIARKLLSIGFRSVADLEQKGISYHNNPYFVAWIDLAFELHFQKEALHKILFSVSQTSSIIQLINWFVQKQNIKGKVEVCNVAQALELALETFATYWKEDKILLQIKWEDFNFDLPTESKDLIFIFRQLIENAIFAMEGKGKLHIFTESEDNTRKIYFSNNGKEIPQEELARIFDPFYTTKSLGQGVGLGLYVTKQMLLSFDATISCNSNSNQTTFCIAFPYYVDKLQKDTTTLQFS
ncbi:MAG: tetratricopeptide repeat protein [Bacteroidia bacterium]|nr:tetratricopeptide repeat protein [Bacteroidia bacterium]MDW8159131.1 tetratricopeptide repeat protein [Bacteroidia bacterium]